MDAPPMTPESNDAQPARADAAHGSATVHRAKEYLRTHGQTVDDWDGVCGELANEVSGPDDGIIYVEPACLWKYHMVPLIDGLVHDAWCDGPPIPVKEWLIRLCGNDDVTVSLNGNDIYKGSAGRFEWPNNGIS